MSNQPQSDTLFRRKFPRRKFRRNIGLLVGGQYQLTAGHEIGEGGIAFLSDEEYEPGQLVIVNFHIPLGGYISVRAEIKNKRAQDGRIMYGCSFLTLKFEAKREIRTFVTARSSLEN